MKIKNLLFNSILIFTSLGFGILICELIGRSIGLGNPVIYERDSIVGYRLKKLQSKIRFKGAKVSSDFEGFRYDSSQIIKSNTKYIIFVGDSVTYGGSYVDDKDIFSSKYCSIIKNNFNCLNNGINSWGVLNMGRFISNFDFYSNRKPEKFILVILPGDEPRNFRSFSDTPFWDSSPREPSAINEVLRYLNYKYFLSIVRETSLENTESLSKINMISDMQRNIIWDELANLIKKSTYPIDIVITPPMSWFIDKSKKNDIEKYDYLLKKISGLTAVKKTCNLYRLISSEYEEGIYHDGVHLTKKGHEIWAKKINQCLN